MTWTREPLVHFLVLGALLFGLFALVNDEASSKSPNRIEITSADVDRLRERWSKQWNRPPTEAELKGLINYHIREEVLYREGLALGLDQNDTIIRRRLAQKMEFLFEDLADQVEPTDEELKNYFDQNNDKYLLPTRVSFSHIYFNIDKRGEGAYDNAKQLLRTLQSNQPVSDQGDRFMLGYEYVQKTQQEVANVFGRQFAEKLFKTQEEIWQGPIESGYGVHLVRLRELVKSRLPLLVEVRARVETDFLSERRRSVNESNYQNFKSRYKILVEERTIDPQVAQGKGQGKKEL